MMGNVGKLSVNLMLTVLTNHTPEVCMSTCTIWMTSFAASRKWSGNSEKIFINQLNCRPTLIGKWNSIGHLLPCAIDFKTNHPPTYLQWFGIPGMSTESHHVISMGPRQPEVSGAASASAWRTLWPVSPFNSISRKLIACQADGHSHRGSYMDPHFQHQERN